MPDRGDDDDDAGDGGGERAVVVGWPWRGDDEMLAPLLLRGGGGNDEERGATEDEPLYAPLLMRGGGDNASSSFHRHDSAASRHKRRQRTRRLRSRAASAASSVGSDDPTVRMMGRQATADSDEWSEYGEEDLEREVTVRELGKTGAARIFGVVAGAGVALASFGVALAASSTLGVAAGPVTAVAAAGYVCLMMTPLVWWSEWRLAHLPALRSRVNDILAAERELKAAIGLLEREKDELEIEVDGLQDAHESLQELVDKTMDGNIDELLELVHENQMILGEMKVYLRQRILQDVVRMVLQSDVTRSGRLSKREAGILETRLALGLEPHGIVFDKEKFRRAVGLSPSLPGVLTIVKRLIPDAEGRTSSFYDDVSDSDEADDDKGEGEEGDMYDMFYLPLEEQCRKGCAESIRLRRSHVDADADDGAEFPDVTSLSVGKEGSVRSMRRLGSISE